MERGQRQTGSDARVSGDLPCHFCRRAILGVRRYQRLSYGNFHGERLREEPEVPGDVLEEALEKFRGQIEFARWKRR